SLQYLRSFGRFSSIDAKLQFLSQNGNDITSYGLSDFYFNANWKLYRSLVLTTGIKLPLINGDIESDLGALPMDYQPSLGTVDAILGFSYSIKKLQLNLVAQQPLSDNENQFLVENHPPNSVLREFQSTNHYKRKGDVMLRVSYALPMGSRATVSPSIQPVYHLGNDEYTDISGNTLEIEGSDGLTLNLNLHIHVRLSRHNAIALGLGAPVITRDVRPDGLTRSFVAGLDYQFRF
ncbi:MAG TPA: hypothetical protein VFX48_03720, partial [Saprospiraceae bacterium]|nr:hypothetical protein [Saprospiraceae bacterium]